MFDKLTELLTSWRSELNQLERDLEGKLQRLEFLQESPLPWSEVADNIIATMARHGEVEFNRNLEQKIAHAVNNPLTNPDDSSAWKPGLITKITRAGDVDPWALFHLLEEPISHAIRAKIEGQTPLPNTGPPRAVRDKELPKLERSIADLRERIQSHRDAAKGAGLDIGELHNRSPVPARPRDLKRK